MRLIGVTANRNKLGHVSVIPAEAGIQNFLRNLGSRLRGSHENRINYRTLKLNIAILGLWIFSQAVFAQPDYSQVEISSVEVAPGIYMLSGAGGNVGLSVGEDGAFLIDDELTPMTEKLREAVASLTDKPVRFVVNTHWHFDHVGGNESLGNQGAIIVAHDNVRERMAKGQFMKAFNMEVPPAGDVALPVLTFDEGVSFHWNGDRIDLKHEAAAHTDGDAVVYFEKANLVHAGDLYWNGMYPLIDADSGGSVEGMIRGVANILSRIDDNTRVIPGHGPVSNKQELQVFHRLLVTVYKRVKGYRDRGMSVEEVVAQKPTAEFDAVWGMGFIPPDNWVAIVYSAIAAE